MTKWWKCDLQVATPAWNFQIPPDLHYRASDERSRRRFAERYMDELATRGIEVIALADHNTGDWIDLMVATGKRKGIVVFPGCEVTTGSGSDGIHLLIIGALDKTTRDFDRLLAGALGFDEKHPPFHQVGSQLQPGSSRKSVVDILDDLPSDYLACAPHALTSNGLASAATVKGDLRRRALTHPRLSAVDPGDCAAPDGTNFTARFRRREHASDVPPLKDLAFISTSDAYRLEDLGRRFCWIRMETPSLEALRQAFLDHDSRIRCDWDPRLQSLPGRDPNQTRHARIEEVRLEGTLGNSDESVVLTFHPGLNIIAGARGTGKSTVIAAFRQLYSTTATLPPAVKEEAELFAESMLADARLSALHCLENSLERQRAQWSRKRGQLTQAASGPPVPTTFRVRVVNQKELYTRIARNRQDPGAPSRNFLAFVDEGLALLESTVPGSWWRRREDAIVEWTAATVADLRLRADLASLPALRARVLELQAQVEAFDPPDAATDERRTHQRRLREAKALRERTAAFAAWLDGLDRAIAAGADATAPLPEDASDDFVGLDTALAEALENTRAALGRSTANVRNVLVHLLAQAETGPWSRRLAEAQAAEQSHFEALRAQGLDPAVFAQVRHQMVTQQQLVRALEQREPERARIAGRVASAWDALEKLRAERAAVRAELFDTVTARSGRLRFKLRPQGDQLGWNKQIRALLGLRSETFLEETTHLAKWLWGEPDAAKRAERGQLWRDALVSGDFRAVSVRAQADLKTPWRKRLESLDEAVRLRLAVEVADDLVEMSFLRDSGNPKRESDWRDITSGSPGQCTAAMLCFLLNHGVEPLVLDQPEDDIDPEWIANLVVQEIRASRTTRQVIIATLNANIPVNADAERIIVLENTGSAIRVRTTEEKDDAGQIVQTPHAGALEQAHIRTNVQEILEGGVDAFTRRHRKYRGGNDGT